MKKKVLLIDGNLYMFKAYFANMYSKNYSQTPLTTKDGIHTNAVFSFIKMILKIQNDRNYFDIKVAFDKGKKTFRHDMIDNYKDKRAKTPVELISQFKLIKEFLNLANIQYFEEELIEADDILGTIANILLKNSEIDEVEILSSDKDMYQLINEKIVILKSKSGVSKLEIIDEKTIMDTWGIKPNQVIDFKALVGDSSDNLKGVSGIGEKTATNLLQKYSTLEGIYNNIADIPKTVSSKLLNDRDNAFLTKTVVTIKKDVEIPKLYFKEIKFNTEGMNKFFKKYEMNSLINLDTKPINDIEINYQIINSWDKDFNDTENYIFIESISDNYHNDSPTGIAISNRKGNFYFSFNSPKENLFSKNNIDENFLNFLNSEKNNFYTHDIKKTVYMLHNKSYEVNLKSFKYDMMIAIYLLDNTLKTNIEEQISFLNITEEIISSEEFYGHGKNRKVDLDINLIAKYSLQKAILIKRTEKEIKNRLMDASLINLFEKIEIPFTYVLFEMEKEGVLVNKIELHKQQERAKIILNHLQLSIKSMVSEYISDEFNIASPMQLKELLFKKLNLKDVKKGSTDKDVLENLKNDHPVIPLILEFRKYQKLYSTYLQGIEKFIYNDSKVHSIYNQVLTNTGRLSSMYPNLQNISIKDPAQKEVRKIFVANADNIFISLDYSQIELRVIADLCPEEKLIEIFNNKGDIHESSARLIFSIPPEVSVTPDQRRSAKIFNFGILYGLSDYGLSKDLGISIAEAKIFISNYFKAFPNIKTFQSELLESAKSNGFVKMISNRRRYIPELQSQFHMIRESGKRAAINAPVQGTASDILKVASILLHDEIKRNNLDVKIVCQIHDEIILEVPKLEVDKIVKIAIETMKIAYDKLFEYCKVNKKANIELEVNYTIGKNWFELK